MEKFNDQLESLKQTFALLPEECLAEAIERMDQTAELLAQSVVFVDNESLVNMGKHFVEDFLDSRNLIQSSTSCNDFFLDEASLENAASSALEISACTSSEFYCYSCGDAFNNRKGLYRHGKTTNHQTRPSKMRKKVENLQIRELVEADPLEKNITASSLQIENSEGISKKSEGKANSKKCHECNSIFPNRKGLYRHGKQTGHRTHLQRALNIKGGSIRCAVCCYSSDKEQNIKKHIQRNHAP